MFERKPDKQINRGEGCVACSMLHLPTLLTLGWSPPEMAPFHFTRLQTFGLALKKGLGLTKPYQNSGPKRQVSRALWFHACRWMFCLKFIKAHYTPNNLPIECAQGEPHAMPKPKFLCAAAFRRSVWWWRFCGGSCVSVVFPLCVRRCGTKQSSKSNR